MKISAIIPTYNRADFIAEAIESVQNQTYSIDEIIIVDDGSNDTTCSILKKFDVKVIKTQNFGVSHARNLGIKEAKNDWVAFLDSDDEWKKDKLLIQANFFKNNLFPRSLIASQEGPINIRGLCLLTTLLANLKFSERNP